MMRFITRTFWLGLIVITGITIAGFVTSNHDLISIRFWPTQNIIQAEIWVFVLGSFGLGTITGATIFWLQSLSLKAHLWSKTKQISELEVRIEDSEQRLYDKHLSSDYSQ